MLVRAMMVVSRHIRRIFVGRKLGLNTTATCSLPGIGSRAGTIGSGHVGKGGTVEATAYQDVMPIERACLEADGDPPWSRHWFGMIAEVQDRWIPELSHHDRLHERRPFVGG